MLLLLLHRWGGSGGCSVSRAGSALRCSRLGCRGLKERHELVGGLLQGRGVLEPSLLVHLFVLQGGGVTDGPPAKLRRQQGPPTTRQLASEGRKPHGGQVSRACQPSRPGRVTLQSTTHRALVRAQQPSSPGRPHGAPPHRQVQPQDTSSRPPSGASAPPPPTSPPLAHLCLLVLALLLGCPCLFLRLLLRLPGLLLSLPTKETKSGTGWFAQR